MLKKILFFTCLFLGLLTPLMVLGQIDSPVFTPQVEIPGFGQVGSTIQVERNTFAHYIIALYNWGLRALVILAIVMIMIAGFRWLTAAGNASLITQAKNQITSALIGLLIGIGSFALLNFINPQLVSLRNLEISEVGKEEDINKDKELNFCEDISVASCELYAHCEVHDNKCISKASCGLQEWMNEQTKLDCCEGKDPVTGEYKYTYAQIPFNQTCGRVCPEPFKTNVSVSRCDSFFCDKLVTNCSKCGTEICCVIANNRCSLDCRWNLEEKKCVSD